MKPRSSYVFDRQQTIKLTKLTSGQLSYLGRVGGIEPYREPLNIGNRENPVFFSFDQILELRTIYELRKKTSLQKIRSEKTFLEDLGKSGDLSEKSVVMINGGIYLADLNSEGVKDFVVELTLKDKGLNGTLSIKWVYEELKKTAKEESESGAVNFELFKEKAREKGLN